MKLFLTLFIFWVYGIQAQDIRDIPPAKSVAEAIANYSLRHHLFVHTWATKREMDRFPFHEGFQDKALSSLTAATARLYSNYDVESVNEYLLDPRFQVALSGTRIRLMGGLCEREGDYDFILQELIRITYFGRGLLSHEAYNRLLFELLSERGNQHFTHFSLGICGTHEDTENHILMTEVARYLTNQLLYERMPFSEFDNEKNGFNDWLLNLLRSYYTEGFDEINSLPYAGYTISSLLNLYDFAQNQQIRDAAKTLLDFLNMKLALESHGLKRYPTFRRQKQYLIREYFHDRDAIVSMNALWTGNYQFLMETDAPFRGLLPYGERFAAVAAMSRYYPEMIILEHMFHPRESLQKYGLHYGNRQVTHVHPNFLISSGGIHKSIFPRVSLVNDVLAVPTTLIPPGPSDKLEDYFYFLGKNWAKRRSNMCVTQGFMCGFNLHSPSNVEGCATRRGDWTFYDFTTDKCESHYHDIYIAIYNQRVRGLRRVTMARTFGLLEVRPADIEFDDFMERVLSQNDSSFRHNRNISYYNSYNDRIRLRINSSKGEYPIISLNRESPKDIRHWPRAMGKYHTHDGVEMMISDGSRHLYYLWDDQGPVIYRDH